MVRPRNQNLLESYIICEDCYGRVTNNKCISCNKQIKQVNYLSVGDLKSQFTSLITDQNFISIVKDTKQKISDNRMGDVFQGSIYKNIAPTLRENDLTLTINSDGFVVNTTSKIEPWPIYLIVNELGPNYRFSLRYAILLGVFYGPKHPNLNKLVEVCCEHQFDVFRRGISVNGNHFNFKLLYA